MLSVAGSVEGQGSFTSTGVNSPYPSRRRSLARTSPVQLCGEALADHVLPWENGGGNTQRP